MERTREISWAIAAIALIGLSACSSTKSGSDGAAGTGGRDAQIDTGGISGTGGSSMARSSTGGGSTGGAVGTGGAPETDATAAVMCGGVPCTPAITPACCTGVGTGVPGNKLEFGGREPNVCGTDLSQYSANLEGICLQLNQPGTLDTSCPDGASPTAGGASLKGCCTDRGFCGVYEGALPLGCEYPGKRGKPCGKLSDAGADAKAGDASKDR